jgi:hypothetical protein
MFGPKCGLIKPLTRPFTSQDSEMICSFFESLKYGGDELVLASRGGGKTTNLRECLVAVLLQGLLTYGVYFGATEAHAARSRDWIKYAIAESAGIYRYYPEVADPVRAVGSSSRRARGMRATGYQYADARRKFTDLPIPFEWSADRLVFPRVPGSPSAASVFESFGLDSPVRGLNTFGLRPDGVFIDDPDTPLTTNPRSIEYAQRIIDRINFDIGGLRGEGQKMCRVMLATLSERGAGVAYQLSEGSPFVVRTHRFLITKPDHLEMWLQYVELRRKGKALGDKYGRKAHEFYLANRRKMDAGAVVANEHRYDSSELGDGTKQHVSALQWYFDEYADKGEMFCRCELDNERVVIEDRITAKVSAYHVAECAGEFPRLLVDDTTSIITRGVDVRKVELHDAAMSSDSVCEHRIIDYNVRSHGTSETTVQQAESLILDGLRRMVDDWDRSPLCDSTGREHATDLTLIDKGWVGSWREDGTFKSWASQPVETFCMEMGLRRFLPAKGAPNYKAPAPSDSCIIGDNWHLNRGEGQQRRCTEVIWCAEHWHLLVEELFMLDARDPDRFELFVPEPGVWQAHKAFGSHIEAGAQQMKSELAAGQRSRKPRFIKDHWWDSCAMMLVAQSVERWFRDNVDSIPRRRVTKRRRQQRKPEELGAR